MMLKMQINLQPNSSQFMNAEACLVIYKKPKVFNTSALKTQRFASNRFKVTMKYIFNGILLFIVNDLWEHIIIVLIMLNESKFLFSISSLLWWRRRGYNLSLTWDQPIANHNHPINSSQTQSNPAHFCSRSWSVSLGYKREEKTRTTSWGL